MAEVESAVCDLYIQVLNHVFQDLSNDKRCKNNYIKVYLNGDALWTIITMTTN